MSPVTRGDWLTVLGALALVSLIPVVWAIVDVARRPTWQFSASRKVVWAVTLGVGWLLLWPLALVSSIVYLTVLRRRFPQASSPPPQGSQIPHYGQYGRYGQYGQQGQLGQQGQHGGHGGPGGPGGPGGAQYGPRPYGGGPYGPGQYGGGPAGGSYGYPAQPPPPLPPAAWYPDPAGSGKERWWDGKGWSEHLR